MNAMKNRKLLVLLGPVLGLVMFAATVKMVSVVMKGEYKQPYRASAYNRRNQPRRLNSLTSSVFAAMKAAMITRACQRGAVSCLR